MGKGWMIVALVFTGLPATGCAKDGPSPMPDRQLPAEVQQLVEEMETECRDVDAVPGDSPELVTVVDLTGDGIDDYVIDQGAFACIGAASLYSGSGGSQMMIYVGTSDGRARPAFGHGHFGVSVERDGSTGQVVLGVGGEACGQNTEGLSRAEYQGCLRPLAWDAARQEFDFAPLSTVRPLEH